MRELDLSSLAEGDLAGVHGVWAAIETEDEPADPPVPVEVVDAFLRHRPASEPLRAWVAEDAGRVLGWSRAELWTSDNLQLGTAEVHVHPDARRRGLGRRLLTEAVGACRDDGRTSLDAYVRRGSTGVPFAERLGYAEKLVEPQRRLDLRTVDRDLLGRWAAEHHPGYSLVAWEQRCPDQLLEAFAELRLVMNDAPLEDFEMEDEASSPELVRDREAATVAAGGWRRTLCARHDATGALAGYTSVKVHPAAPWKVEQGDTGVSREHRGSGLGRWLKGTMVLWLLEHRPEARVVETGNAGSNAHMIAINEDMGFQVHSVWGIWQAPLDQVADALAASAGAR